MLERGFILRLVAACVHVRDGRVREALEELAVHRLRQVDLETGAFRLSSRGNRSA